MIHSKYSWISDAEYDSSSNSNLSLHVGADVFKFIIVALFNIFPYSICYGLIGFNISTSLSLLFKFILSERLNNSLWDEEVLILFEFIHITLNSLYCCRVYSDFF